MTFYFYYFFTDSFLQVLGLFLAVHPAALRHCFEYSRNTEPLQP